MSRHDGDVLHYLPVGEDSLPTGPRLLGDDRTLVLMLDQGGIVLTGLVEDFMVSLVEASKCLQVENIISCCGECVGIPPRLEC